MRFRKRLQCVIVVPAGCARDIGVHIPSHYAAHNVNIPAILSPYCASSEETCGNNFIHHASFGRAKLEGIMLHESDGVDDRPNFVSQGAK